MPEDGNSAITDGTRADTALPIFVFTLEAQTLGTGTSCDNDCVSSLGLLIFLTLTPVSERTGREIEACDGFGDDSCAKPDGLVAEFVHELGAEDASRETGEVLD